MDDRRTLLMDDLPRRVPSGAVAPSPSPGRWLTERMDGGAVLTALPGSRAPDLVLSPDARGLYRLYVGLCSFDGQPSEVEVRVEPDGPSRRLRLEEGEVDCREVSFGTVEATGRSIVLRHPPGARSCVSHVKLAPS